MIKRDVIIIGAGAAGLMCAIEAAKRGRKVTILEHSNKPGKKILMAGGGRCNFTNYYIEFNKYISQNPHFCKSALSRYTQWDFISLVEKYKIEYYEKTLGQLFCVHKAQEILKMLLAECDKYNVELKLNTAITEVKKVDNGYEIITQNVLKEKTSLHGFNSPLSRGLTTPSSRGLTAGSRQINNSNHQVFHAESLVIATGGLSIPSIGASPFGYNIAKQFGLNIVETRAGLVPLRLNEKLCADFNELSGVSCDSIVSYGNTSFKESMLFTHRGLSGPSILQISSYWQQGNNISINMLPEQDFLNLLLQAQQDSPNKSIKNIIYQYLPKSIVNKFLTQENLEKPIKQFNSPELENIANLFTNWRVKPVGTEGYRTAEVTLGGVDVNQISSKTMQARNVDGLYFIGEVLDVTGWLGGYNFQWAWSSGWVAGQYV